MKIYIGSDHAGFKLKAFLAEKLEGLGYEIEDTGPKEFDRNDDFPKTTEALVKKIAEYPREKGILLCKNGVGVSIFANRFKNVRAGLSWTEEHAISHRQDDNSNILVLPAGFISKRKALKTAKAWLKTEFKNKEKYNRRLHQIEELSK